MSLARVPGGARRRPVPAVARWLSLALCAAALVLGAALPAGASPSSASSAGAGALAAALSAAPSTETASKTVSVSIDSLSPGTISSDQDLTVSGTITNGTSEALSGASLVLGMQTRTELQVSSLAAWLAGDRWSTLSTLSSKALDADVPAGSSTRFSVTVKAADLPLWSTDQWGPRGIEVSIVQGGSSVASDRSIVVWDAGAPVSGTHVTAVVPVTASPAELALLASGTGSSSSAPASASPSPTAEPSSAATSSSGGSGSESSSTTSLTALRDRVLGLLGLARQGVVLAVDPALLEALGLPSEADSPTATALPTDSSASPNATATASAADGSASATASPSTTATASADATADASPAAGTTPVDQTGPGAEIATALAQAIQNGDVIALAWDDADVSALAHAGETALLSSALTRSASSWTSTAGARTDVAWTAGPLDQSTLDALPSSVSTVIASPGDMPVAQDLTYTPSEATTVNGRVVLLPDSDLSAAASGEVETTSGTASLSELDATQLLLGESAIITRQAPSITRDLVLTVSREEAQTTDPEVLGERLAAVTGSSWTSGQGLAGVASDATLAAASSTEVLRSAVPASETSAGEVSRGELGLARATSGYLASVASILTDPSAALGTSADILLQTTSATWRSDASGRGAHIKAARATAAAVTSRLTAAPSSTINLISDTAELPVRIVSRLDQEVTVSVHLSPDSQRLQAEQDVSVTVPAHSEVTVKVPVTAVGSGDVDVTVQLLSSDGTVVGTPSTVHMRVRADWENVGTRAIGGALVVMLVIGITRTIRRGRRTDTHEEKA